MTEIRVVHTEGDAAARGKQAGRALGDLIERSIGFYHSYMERRGIESRELQDFLAPYLVATEEHVLRFGEMIKAMAEGAMVPVWELFAVNSFEELEPLLAREPGRPSFLQRVAGYGMPTKRGAGAPPDRCSSFTVTGPDFTLLGHNEQWLAGDVGNVAVVIEVPSDGTPALASPTVVCCLPAVGINEYGGAQAIQSLIASDDRVGVPRVLVSRNSLEAVYRMDAVTRARMPGRAGGYGHLFAFAGGDTFIVETSGQQFSVLEGPGPHTNHYLDPDLAELGPKQSEGSTSRYDRLIVLLEERQPTTPEAVMEVLSDHESEPQAICLHPDEEEGDEAAAIVFSMVCDVESRRLWVAAGNPCTAPFEEIDISAVVG